MTSGRGTRRSRRSGCRRRTCSATSSARWATARFAARGWPRERRSCCSKAWRTTSSARSGCRTARRGRRPASDARAFSGVRPQEDTPETALAAPESSRSEHRRARTPSKPPIESGFAHVPSRERGLKQSLLPSVLHPHPRFKPGAGSSPLPSRERGYCPTAPPRASPAFASLRVPFALRKGRATMRVASASYGDGVAWFGIGVIIRVAILNWRFEYVRDDGSDWVG